MRVVHQKRLYNKEIRQLIRTRKEIKRNHNGNDDHLCCPLNILDKRTDKKIDQYNNDIMHYSVGHKHEQQFWRLKITLTPESICIPHSATDSLCYEVKECNQWVSF